MTLVFLAAEGSGEKPPWLDLMLVLIPAAAAVAVAWLGAPWLKEKITERNGSTTEKSSSSSPTPPPPVVAVQPADPLVVKLIEGLQSDLRRARQNEQRLIDQRMLDIETIARLNAELDDAETKAEKCQTDLMLARRMEEDVKRELIELRAKVLHLGEELRRAREEPYS